MSGTRGYSGNHGRPDQRTPRHVSDLFLQPSALPNGCLFFLFSILCSSINNPTLKQTKSLLTHSVLSDLQAPNSGSIILWLALLLCLQLGPLTSDPLVCHSLQSLLQKPPMLCIHSHLCCIHSHQSTVLSIPLVTLGINTVVYTSVFWVDMRGPQMDVALTV